MPAPSQDDSADGPSPRYVYAYGAHIYPELNLDDGRWDQSRYEHQDFRRALSQHLMTVDYPSSYNERGPAQSTSSIARSHQALSASFPGEDVDSDY